MLRSIRVPLLAGIVALMFVACGGGGDDDGVPDGGNGDGGGHIQFDAQKDGLQQDGGQSDGSAGCSETCNPSGGAQIAGFCKCTSDCNCGSGNACMNISTNTATAGSCWKSCAASTECNTSAEECVGITQTVGACLPKGTLAGNFSVPSWLDADTMTQDLGTASVTLTIGSETVTFGGGYMAEVTFSDGSTAWEADLFPVSGGQIDVSRVLRIIVEPKTAYSVTTYDLSSTTSAALIIVASWTLSGSAFTAQSIYAMILGGTLQFTAAGAGGGALSTGSITGGEAFKYILEICGSHSTPC